MTTSLLLRKIINGMTILRHAVLNIFDGDVIKDFLLQRIYKMIALLPYHSLLLCRPA